MKCKGKNKDGSPCKAEARAETGGFCFVHYKQEKGEDPEKIKVRAQYLYHNGSISGRTISLRAGQVLELTLAEYDQIMADDQHVLMRL